VAVGAPEERVDGVQGLLPAGFVAHQGVVYAVDRDELGARDAGGEQAALVKGHGDVVLAMQDQRRTADLREQFGDVDRVEDPHEAHGDLGRRRDPLELVEPLMLLLGSGRDDLGGEELPVAAVFLGPSLLGELAHRLGLSSFLWGGRTGQSTPHEAAVQDQLGDALRATDRERNRHRRTLREPEDGDGLVADGRCDGLQVVHPALEADLLGCRVRQATTPGVVADVAAPCAHRIEPVPHQRVGGVELEVRQPHATLIVMSAPAPLMA
jgi:hypothetical protein